MGEPEVGHEDAAVLFHKYAIGPRPQPRPKGAALDELHRHEHLALEDAGVVDCNDVRVGEPRHRLRFAEHPRAPLLGLVGVEP